MESQRWVFYSQNEKGLEISSEVKTCIKPSRTKLWKKLENLLGYDDTEIHRVGYITYKNYLEEKNIGLRPKVNHKN